VRAAYCACVPTAETHYAKNGNVHVAYQVTGDGPIDVVWVPGFVSHLELMWDSPVFARPLERAMRYSRLIRFDKRGTGLSDRGVGVPSLDERMEDLHAVMDAAGSERAAIVGVSEGGPMGILFAATYPDRTTALVLNGSFARIARGPDQDFGYPEEDVDAIVEGFASGWGDGHAIANFFPSMARDPAVLENMARLERNSASPGAVAEIIQMVAEIDVRPILSTISVPTLVIHHTGDPVIPVENGRYLAEHIPGARYLEIDDDDHLTIRDDAPAADDDIEEFLTGARPAMTSERILSTVLFTDIVGSTERAAGLGDAKWRGVLDRHDELVRREVERHRGREVKHTGDGFLAAFDGPARAVQCGLAVAEAARPLGIELRAGVHTGECERRGNDLGGIAVHTGARVAALAGPSEVLVTRTVKDLVAGSGLRFTDRGEHELKGVPDRWQVYAAEV
jgi:pimeloyl-ACP methyl ester carboxylesterase